MNGKDDHNKSDSVFCSVSCQCMPKQYYNLCVQIKRYIEGMNIMPPTMDVLAFFNYFKMEGLSDLNNITFNTLTEEQKTYLSIINISAQYIEELSRISEYFISSDSDKQNNDKKPWLSELDAVRSVEYLYAEELSFMVFGHILKKDKEPFDIKSLSDIQTRKRFAKRTFPPIGLVFNHLTHIKRSFHFFLELFYHYYGSLTYLHFDRKAYDSIFESIAKENYELFRDIIYKWDNQVVNKMLIVLEIVYPILYYFESQITNYDIILSRINKELTSFDSRSVLLDLSPIRVIIHFLIIFLFRNIVEEYLNEEQRIAHYKPFENQTMVFVKFFFAWIDNEIKAISDFFSNNPFEYLKEHIQIDNPNTTKSVEILDEKSNEHSKNQDSQDSKLEQPGDNNPNPTDNDKQAPLEDTEPKIDVPDYIKVRCGQKMLEKLINGLINGHKDETLGYFTPLVTSKTGEDREAIKKKLICLFTGEGINDESIKWPYDLKWNDKANSLKLLVYLLLYEGIVLSLSDAVDENNYDGICEKIKTNFTGKHVWNIVGNALSYKSLRNKAKIPKESNISLMKKLASFYIDCQKLDD